MEPQRVGPKDTMPTAAHLPRSSLIMMGDPLSPVQASTFSVPAQSMLLVMVMLTLCFLATSEYLERQTVWLTKVIWAREGEVRRMY